MRVVLCRMSGRGRQGPHEEEDGAVGKSRMRVVERGLKDFSEGPTKD